MKKVRKKIIQVNRGQRITKIPLIRHNKDLFKDLQEHLIQVHSAGKKTVLIVDDSAAIRKILHRVLMQAEVPLGKVHEANDGMEALEKLKAEKVGLILSDINMPNMDGIELLGKLKADATFKSVPILMVTTEGSQAKVLQALELGANGYVRKPMTKSELMAAIASVLTT